jgi:hypothetical protein
VALGLVATSVRAFGAEPAQRAVVFVEPASQELDSALRDALSAQLSGGNTSLVFEHFADDRAPLRFHMAEAETFARAHTAAGVFWLDTQPDGDWLLYLSDPGGDRLLARRIEVDSRSTAAAVEAVGVITRQSADALLAGGTIGMQPIAPSSLPIAPSRPEPTPFDTPTAPVAKGSPPPRKRAGAGVALSVAYAGDFLSKATGWQSGVTMAAGYHFSLGLYLAAGYTFIREAEVNISPVVFRLTRTPLYVEAGYAFGHGRLVPSAGLRGIVDVVGRHGFSTDGTFADTPDSTRAVVLLSPRIRLDYEVSPVFGVFVAAGADFELNGFSFVSRTLTQDKVLLEPNVVRPSIEVGLAFWP